MCIQEKYISIFSEIVPVQGAGDLSCRTEEDFAVNGMEVHKMLEDLLCSERPEDLPGLHKLLADMEHHKAVAQQADRQADPEEEAAFQSWLAGQSLPRECDAAEQRALFTMSRALEQIEQDFACMDTEDRGRALHEFWWYWRGLVMRHAPYLERYNALRAQLECDL